MGKVELMDGCIFRKKDDPGLCEISDYLGKREGSYPVCTGNFPNCCDIRKISDAISVYAQQHKDVKEFVEDHRRLFELGVIENGRK